MADAPVSTIDRSAELIRARSGANPPRLAIILGSGLAAIARDIEGPVLVPYADLPGFPVSHVQGHENRLVLGRLGGLPVACLEGRVHFYEGADAAAMAVPIRALRRAGIEMLLITNAAGSLRREIAPGQLMLIADHINFLPGNPLVGRNDESLGPRFPSLRDAYDPRLRQSLNATAVALGLALAEGVYLAYSGPSFETPAEIRAFRILGADAVGMSTVPEVILARHCGFRVAAISVIANYAEGMTADSPTHAHTLEMAKRAAGDLGRLIAAFCANLAHE